MHETKRRDAAYLHRLDNELFEIGFEHSNYISLQSYEKSYQYDPEEQINASLSLSNAVATTYTERPHAGPPHFRLTQQAITFAQNSYRPPLNKAPIAEAACLEMEPRLMRSLSWHEAPSYTSYIEEKHKPAAILFGSDGQPCAYQKASGNGHAYVWRDADFTTQAGTFCLQEDSFIQILYEPGDDPREYYRGRSLIALERALLPQSINFLRFSTASLTTTLRIQGAYATTDREPKLYQNITELAGFDSFSFGKRVQKLLKQERALRVAR